MVPCTTLGKVIANVTYDTEHVPVRNLPYLKSRCAGKGPCGFGSFEFFLLHFKLFFLLEGTYLQSSVRGICYLKCKSLLHVHWSPKKVSSGQGFCIMFFSYCISSKFVSDPEDMFLKIFRIPYMCHVPETVISPHCVCVFFSPKNNLNTLSVTQNFSFQPQSTIFFKLSNGRIQNSLVKVGVCSTTILKEVYVCMWMKVCVCVGGGVFLLICTVIFSNSKWTIES